MATNTNKKKCKYCGDEFLKKSPLQYLCGMDCEREYKYLNAPDKKHIKTKVIYRKQTKIKNYSNNNKITQSSGTKLTSAALSKLITKAKESKIQMMIDNYGYVFCEDCNEFGKPKNINEMDLKVIDCSHNVSVKEAKEKGISELSHDVDNIRMRCRYHHRIHDKTL